MTGSQWFGCAIVSACLTALAVTFGIGCATHNWGPLGICAFPGVRRSDLGGRRLRQEDSPGSLLPPLRDSPYAPEGTELPRWKPPGHCPQVAPSPGGCVMFQGSFPRETVLTCTNLG